MVIAGVQALIPETGQNGLDWIRDVDQAGGLFFVGVAGRLRRLLRNRGPDRVLRRAAGGRRGADPGADRRGRRPDACDDLARDPDRDGVRARAGVRRRKRLDSGIARGDERHPRVDLPADELRRQRAQLGRRRPALRVGDPLDAHHSALARLARTVRRRSRRLDRPARTGFERDRRPYAPLVRGLLRVAGGHGRRAAPQARARRAVPAATT